MPGWFRSRPVTASVPACAGSSCWPDTVRKALHYLIKPSRVAHFPFTEEETEARQVVLGAETAWLHSLLPSQLMKIAHPVTGRHFAFRGKCSSDPQVGQ